METLLVLQFRSNWGKAYVYPVCQQSGMLAALMNKKTFSARDLRIISMLGFRIGFNNIPEEKIEPFNENNFHSFQKFLDLWR